MAVVESTPKQARTILSIRNMGLLHFCNSLGVVFIEYLEEHKTINGGVKVKCLHLAKKRNASPSELVHIYSIVE